MCACRDNSLDNGDQGELTTANENENSQHENQELNSFALYFTVWMGMNVRVSEFEILFMWIKKRY